MSMIYRREPGSCVTFGPFEKHDFYDIEKSKDVGTENDKLKSVEFIVLYNGKLVFVEAKKTAPKFLSEDKAVEDIKSMLRSDQQKSFLYWRQHNVIKSSYVADICDKFVMSMCLALSVAEHRIASSEMPHNMIEKMHSPDLHIVFVLVITWSKPDWSSNVQAALNKELRKYEKTNKAKVLVLTAEQAKRRGLVDSFERMPSNT